MLLGDRAYLWDYPRAGKNADLETARFAPIDGDRADDRIHL